MASYDKEKLLRLMNEREASHHALRHLGGRARDAKLRCRHLEDVLRRNAARLEVAEKLLAMPVAEAVALEREQVEGYMERRGDVTIKRQSRISYAAFQEYLAAREKSDRLAATYAESSQAHQERFAIVPRLRDAVMDWGFRDPELEML